MTWINITFEVVNVKGWDC